ncbi:hypothetical protein [Sphingobacterium sp. MYb382]|uniref:hypothetical protein n=1 Tax=Sphingobacterium sp. MYb382 TaxID=2745278 RepID=UPI0030B45F77
MSTTTKLKDLPIEALQEKRKRFRAFVIILGVITFLAVVAFLYAAVVGSSYKLSIPLGGFSMALFLCALILKQIEDELKSRNLKA